MKRILVTGGAGYIGCHVVRALGEQGFDVLTFDNLTRGYREAVLNGKLVVGDLADSAFLDSVVGDFKPHAVMHFAAFIEVGESIRKPLKYYVNNASNTINLLRSMERHGVANIIFSSTAAVYGRSAEVPIKETQEIAPINPYGQAKAFIEKVLADLSEAGSCRSVSLRYFNAAGADPDVRIGERHDPESHLIPLVLKAAAGRRANISIFGTDYPTPDGTCVRDYIHVDDLAQAHLLALTSLLEGGRSDVFNCGYGRGYSVGEVIDAARRVTGRDIPVEVADRRPGDSPVLVADSTKLQKILHWKPRYDDLDFIIKTAWAWEQKQQ